MKPGQEQGISAKRDLDPWREHEEVRRRRLREDGKRSLATNLAEGLALTEFLSSFTGSARKK